MADIVVNADQVAVVFPLKAEIYDFIAGEAINPGQAVYVNANGKLALADANGSGTVQFRGIALKKGGPGQAVSVLLRGHVAGFDVSGLAYDAPVYVSNTAGALADAAGGTSLLAGRVIPITDRALTKLLFITGWAG